MSIAQPDHAWIKSTGLIISGGCLTCTVLRKASPESYHPFVVCEAAWSKVDDMWHYFRGDYHLTVEDALNNPRIKGS